MVEPPILLKCQAKVLSLLFSAHLVGTHTQENLSSDFLERFVGSTVAPAASGPVLSTVWYFCLFLDIRESHIRKENVSPVFVLPLVFPSVYACEETCSLRWTPYSVCLN